MVCILFCLYLRSLRQIFQWILFWVYLGKKKGINFIFVVIDRFSKMIHFIECHKIHDITNITKFLRLHRWKNCIGECQENYSWKLRNEKKQKNNVSLLDRITNAICSSLIPVGKSVSNILLFPFYSAENNTRHPCPLILSQIRLPSSQIQPF